MPYASASGDLAPFQELLIGTWSNDGVPRHTPDGKPLSYNVMPLPQVEPQKGHPCCDGYILKNFTYTETIRFNGSAMPKDPKYDPHALAVTGNAPNRGGRYTQNSHVLFYEQQVQFAEGPNGPKPGEKVGQIVHVENGAWLHLQSGLQQLGPYGPQNLPGPVVPQPPEIAIAKQIAVPHGNAVLALGSFEDITHQPLAIPDATVPLPMPADLSAFAYYTKLDQLDDYENPNPEWTWNPNKPLQICVGLINPNGYLHWRVTTDPLGNEHGIVTNIPFEQRRADVTGYTADYWLLSTDGGKTFDYLAYTQTIIMRIPIRGQPYCFPHVTGNIVKKVPHTPT